MPDGRWYPFGRPEWWREFIEREARGWGQIGRAAGQMFDPRTPMFPPAPSPYAPPEYPMPTLRPMRPGEERIFEGRPTLPERREWWETGIRPERGMPPTAEMFPSWTGAQAGRFKAFGVLSPQERERRVSMLSQIFDVGGILGKGYSPEELKADLTSQLDAAIQSALQAGQPVDQLRPPRGLASWQEASWDDLMKQVPYQDFARTYARLRTQANRLPSEMAKTEAGREQLWKGKGWAKKPLETGGFQWIQPVGVSPEEREVAGVAAERQQQISKWLNEFQRDVKRAIQGAETVGEVNYIESQARDLMREVLPEGGFYNEPGSILGQTAIGLSFQTDIKRRRLEGERGELLAGDYRKWWEEFGKTPTFQATQQERYISPEEKAGWFNRWAKESPEFQEARREREMGLYRDYQFTYPAYQRAGGLMGTKETLPAWLKRPEPTVTRERELEYGIAQRARGRRVSRWAVARA